MDGFELDVHQPRLDQQRQLVLLVMQEALEAVQALHHLFGGWWHKGRVSRTAASDPVL